MTNWILNTWKIRGYHRLYAEAPDGTRLGYLDLKANELHPTTPGALPDLTAAVSSYLTRADLWAPLCRSTETTR